MIKLAPPVIFTGLICFAIGMLLGKVLMLNGFVAILILTAVFLLIYTIYVSQLEVTKDD